MNENTDVTIKILTDNMPLEFKFLLYSFVWTLTTFNILIYVHILKNLKEMYFKKNYESVQLQEIQE